MPTQDIRSNLDSRIVARAVIATDADTNGQILDTAHFDLGVMLTMLCTAFSAGTFTLSLLESDDPAMAGATVVPAEKLIGALPALTALTAVNTPAETVGFFSTKRYIQPVITSAGGANGTIIITATQKAETMPTSAPGNTGVLV